MLTSLQTENQRCNKLWWGEKGAALSTQSENIIKTLKIVKNGCSSTMQKSRLVKATKDNRPNVNNRNIYDAVSAGTGQILLIVLDLLDLFCLLTEPLLSQRALKLVLTFIEGIFELLEGLRERERRFIFLHQFIQVYPWQQIWKWGEKIKKKKTKTFQSGFR